MLLEVKGLGVSYGAEELAERGIADVNLRVDAGEIVGLVGASGSGKSTALLAILGVVRGTGRIVAGSIEYEGTELLGLQDEELRAFRGSRIALITQNPRASLNPLLRVGEQLIAIYRAHTDATRAGAELRAIELMKAVGIGDPERRLRAYPHDSPVEWPNAC